MKTSKVITATLIATAALLLTGCGGSTSQSSTDGSTQSSGSSTETKSSEQALKDLQASGVLTIGTEGTYAPFSYHDTATSELTGYDIEVITAVADYLGVKPEFSEVKWDGIFAGLDSGRYDVIANQVAVTPEREELYDFSQAYAVSNPVVIVKSDNENITKLDDVAGKNSAQSVTSNWAELAKQSGATVVPVDGFTEAVSALRDGRVDITFNDNLAVLEYFKTTNDNSVKVGLEIPEEKSEQAFVTRKDSGLAELLSEALVELDANGTLEEIGQKYFDVNISK